MVARACTVLAVVATGLAACMREPARGADSGTAGADSPAMPVPPVAPPAGAPVDTPTPVISQVRPYRRDTTTYAATGRELAELRRGLAIPVAGVRAADLRDTYSEARSGGRAHDAIDILAPRGTPVLAAVDGRLNRLHSSDAGGLMIYQADATDRFVLMYGHLDRYAAGLVEGASLRRGQVIGYVGTTGNAPPGTPHLHFAIARGRPSAAWWRGTAVNPYPLLAASGR